MLAGHSTGQSSALERARELPALDEFLIEAIRDAEKVDQEESGPTRVYAQLIEQPAPTPTARPKWMALFVRCSAANE